MAKERVSGLAAILMGVALRSHGRVLEFVRTRNETRKHLEKEGLGNRNFSVSMKLPSCREFLLFHNTLVIEVHYNNLVT